MGFVEKIKFWRTAGVFLNSSVGQTMADSVRGPVNKILAVGARSWTEQTPWTPFETPLSKARIAVVTTGGFHLKTDKPFDVDAAKGDPSFREFPSDFATEDLTVTHMHYSHKRLEKDLNAALPIDRLRELVEAGVIGGITERIFSTGFAGGITGGFIDPEKGTAHDVARKLKDDGADAVLMVPT
jgi:D-proline reductase (dithiol) PrdB